MAFSAGCLRPISWPRGVTTPIYGRLAHLLGRKRVFYVELCIFLIGSTDCGLSRGIIPPIAFRTRLEGSIIIWMDIAQ